MLEIAKNPLLWEKIRTDDTYKRHREELFKRYDEVFKREVGAHTVKEILEKEDNMRWYYTLHQLQTSAILSLIYPENEEYFNNLLKVIWAYCDTYTWAPLGHYNHYYNITPDDYDIGVIDIFAASIAFSLSEIKHIFGERLPRLIRDRISAELRRRTIEPFLERSYFWEKHDNNWAAVCAAGVGATLMYEAPELYFENIDRIDSAMQSYLDGYEDDGACVEGAGYWGFGFGFFVSYALLQREITGGERDWFKNEKVKQISAFAQRIFLQKDITASFSDCTPGDNYWIGLPHILRDVYGDYIEKLPDSAASIVNYTHFPLVLRSFVCYNPEYSSDDIKTDVVYNMKNTGYFTKRKGGYGFTFKGGNNGESHNHNDVGSFILAKNNKQYLCDIGAGQYSNAYHFTDRYSFFHPSSFSHNLPFFNGIGQDGIRRENAYTEYNESEESAYMDFTAGYGIKELKRAERKFYFNEEKIEMHDTFTLDSPMEITERFISLTEPQVEGKTVKIYDMTITPKDEIMPKITLEVHKTHKGDRDEKIYCIDYVLPTDKTEFYVKFEFNK